MGKQTNNYPGLTDLWKDKTEAQRKALRRQEDKRYNTRYRKADGSHGSRRFHNEEEAKSWLRQMHQTPEKALSDAQKAATVNVVMGRWLATKRGGVKQATMTAYEQDARGVTDTFGDWKASAVTEQDVIEWSLDRERCGVSMRRRQVTAIKGAFHLARKAKLIEVDVVEDVKMPRKEDGTPNFLNWDQLDDFVTAMGDTGPLVMLLGTGGMRLEEAIACNYADINYQQENLFIADSKTENGQDRWVPLVPEAIALFPRGGSGPLFTGVRGGRLNSSDWRAREFIPTAEKVLRDRNDKPMHLKPHELRHTAASLAIDSGAQADHVANMLGHADPGFTYRTYIHKFKARANQVGKKMGEAQAIARQERAQRRTTDAQGTQTDAKQTHSDTN